MSTSRTASIAIAKRYATAMFELATQSKQHAALVGELRILANAIHESPELAETLKNPLLSREKKSAILQALMKQASPLAQQSLNVLAQQGRSDVIPYVADALDALLANYEGSVNAQVTSAKPLSKEMERQLRDTIAEATGREVKLTFLHNPAVLGGVAVRVGSHLLDATLAGALSSIRTQLLAATI